MSPPEVPPADLAGADVSGADRTVDASGLQCPLPVLKARKALLGMAPGEKLLVIATDPMAAIDIPHFCAETGHRLVASSSGGGTHRFLIERGPA
jgi:tRNA 2-thiouridine synthesizing protein A